MGSLWPRLNLVGGPCSSYTFGSCHRGQDEISKGLIIEINRVKGPGPSPGHPVVKSWA